MSRPRRNDHEARAALGALVLPVLLLGSSAPAGAGTVRKIRDVGPDDNRLVFVIVGDGYQSSEEADFDGDAQRAIDGLLAETPYREYATFVNCYTDFVPSNESGADKPAACFGTEVLRDTAFNATYCSSGIRRLLTVNSGAVFSLVNADVPSWDVAAVVVNDTEYGGAGGGLLTFSIDPGALEELFLHEAGHTYGRLADEYEGNNGLYPGGEPREPNVTIETDPDVAKWTAWIDGITGVGLFEGGRYYSQGIYRPRPDCKMRTLNRGFCPICQEAHLQELYDRVSPIDGELPAAGPASIPNCGTASFTLLPQQPDPMTLTVSWELDGAPLPGQTGWELVLDAIDLGGVSGSLVALVRDETELVRRHYLSPMEDSRSWTVQREAPLDDLDADGIDDACDPDIDGDGLLNDEDCAPRDPVGNDPPGEVAGLRVVRQGAAVRLSWEDLLGGGATRHAVTTGRLSELAAHRGFAAACRLEGDATPELVDARPLPPVPGAAGWYYLVQAESACGLGDAGNSRPPERDARAGLDWDSLPACF